MAEQWVGGNLICVRKDARTVTTWFPDGRRLDATPEGTEAAWDKARELGYSCTWAMSRDHEILHTFLAMCRGYSFSPTLYNVTCPGTWPAADRDLEE